MNTVCGICLDQIHTGPFFLLAPYVSYILASAASLGLITEKGSICESYNILNVNPVSEHKQYLSL